MFFIIQPLFNHYFYKKTKPLYPTPKYLFGSGIWIWAAKNLKFSLRVSVVDPWAQPIKLRLSRKVIWYLHKSRNKSELHFKKGQTTNSSSIFLFLRNELKLILKQDYNSYTTLDWFVITMLASRLRQCRLWSFLREGYKIRKIFGYRSTVVKWNYWILRIGVVASC